jgi:oxygen-independent coproporphyrinogen-3 oxidase
MLETPSSLYIHIPFCRNICDYCSFTVVRGNQVPDVYIDALKKDWLQSINPYKQPILLKTIYFGGGTPSLLSNEQLKGLLQFFSEWVNPNTCEITLEANPTSLLNSKLDAWLEAGVNRISMGVQSFSKETLRYLTRTHSPALSKKAVQTLKNSGVKSFNIDLIFGMKTQSVEEFAEDLLYLLEQEPSHISAYELTIEENTPFYETKQKQRNEDEIAEMMEILVNETTKNNINRYEISNFAKSGHQSQHNINYWRNLPYFGIGCGAFSYLNQTRFSKEKNPKDYIQKINSGFDPIDQSEHLEGEKAARETLFLGLRMVEGISLNDFYNQTKFDAKKLIDSKLTYFQNLDLIQITNERLFLTQKGIRVANSVLSEFV